MSFAVCVNFVVCYRSSAIAATHHGAARRCANPWVTASASSVPRAASVLAHNEGAHGWLHVAVYWVDVCAAADAWPMTKHVYCQSSERAAARGVDQKTTL